ncbi:FkbM family methyltransferase [Robertmurraya korlensis]|uniref:FkbM family methyltransferase n=1 Tax=Robertmurraya korlensis TaxID=519977 RepID=UPI000824177D|nr:FkbM family methyltransferase [Robertmurraya korlensis]
MVNDFRNRLLDKDLFPINAAGYANRVRDKANIIIWGSSVTGQYVYDFLKEFNIEEKVKFFADNNKTKWGGEQDGISILSPKEVKEFVKNDQNTYVIIASQRLEEIKQQMLSLGVKEENIDIIGFRLAWDYLRYRGKTPLQLIYDYLYEFEEVFSSLADERSRDVYLGLLNYKISLDNKYIQEIYSPSEQQYFDKEIIEIKDNEVFCDCGSFNGDTLEKFISLTKGKYSKFLAIEADKELSNIIRHKVNELNYERVQVYNYACWDRKASLKFESNQSSGHVSLQGDSEVDADTLDSILKDENPTFIKMDIEGAEEKALLGASNLIRGSKPLLAICVYHNLYDYYKLPLIMKSLNKDYILLMRHYSEFSVETVCYAIPRDRYSLSI